MKTLPVFTFYSLANLKRIYNKTKNNQPNWTGLANPPLDKVRQVSGAQYTS